MIIMIDTETTSLSPSNGVAHQLAYYAYDGVEHQELQVDLPTTEDHWDANTLKWAQRNDTLPEIAYGRSSDWISEARMSEASWFVTSLKRIKAGAGRRPISVVFKHPEFDIPFLEQEGIDIRELFGHRNIYDLNSLVRGYYAGQYPNGSLTTHLRLTEAHFKVGKVPHTALEDCKLQMDQLRKANYGGLLSCHSL